MKVYQNKQIKNIFLNDFPFFYGYFKKNTLVKPKVKAGRWMFWLNWWKPGEDLRCRRGSGPSSAPSPVSLTWTRTKQGLKVERQIRTVSITYSSFFLPSASKNVLFLKTGGGVAVSPIHKFKNHICQSKQADRQHKCGEALWGSFVCGCSRWPRDYSSCPVQLHWGSRKRPQITAWDDPAVVICITSCPLSVSFRERVVVTSISICVPTCLKCRHNFILKIPISLSILSLVHKQ